MQRLHTHAHSGGDTVFISMLHSHIPLSVGHYEPLSLITAVASPRGLWDISYLWALTNSPYPHALLPLDGRARATVPDICFKQYL